MKKLCVLVLALALLASLAACVQQPAAAPPATQAPPAPATEAPAAPAPEPAAEQVVIKLFSNLPDRANGQGLVEQMLVDSYMAENPNVKIEIEALQDEPYKTKFRAYSSGNDMPDVVSAWGQPSFLYEVIDAGLLLELNPADYASYGFIPGSLDGFSKGGKLYGLPRNTDVMGFYYNKAMFEAHGWSVPTTYAELLDLAKKMTDAKVIPCAMAGGDKWPLAIYITDLLAKIEGSYGDGVQSAVDGPDFTAPAFAQAAQLLQDAQKAGLFQNGFETADYGAAKNLFINGQSAMFYMGSWEMSMATGDDVLPEVRENLGVFMMPAVDDGKGTVADIAAWNGGGYAISSKTTVKDEAVKFLNYMFKPENWTKIAWEKNICMSAQDFSAFATGSETPVQLQFTDIVAKATSISGTTINDRGNSAFKTTCENAVQELAIGKLTPQEFIAKLASK